jgi:hypothetical protein
MYFKLEPKKVTPDLIELVASALGLGKDIEKDKPKILAVAVANRFKGSPDETFKDNPRIEILESNPPTFKVLLTYKHPFGLGVQEYCYIVNTERMEGQFTWEHYDSMR